MLPYDKKSLEEIFNEIWPLARNQSSDHRNLYGNIIFNENPYENALKFLASGKGFYGVALQARIFGAVRAENKSKNLFFAESREK